MDKNVGNRSGKTIANLFNVDFIASPRLRGLSWGVRKSGIKRMGKKLNKTCDDADGVGHRISRLTLLG